MNFRGVEWVLPVVELAMIVVPLYGFFTLLTRVRKGMLARTSALGRYAGIVIAPTVLYAVFFFALVGFEELTRMSILTEGLGRSFFLIVGLGLVIWVVSMLAFTLALAFAGKRKSSPSRVVP